MRDIYQILILFLLILILFSCSDVLSTEQETEVAPSGTSESIVLLYSDYNATRVSVLCIEGYMFVKYHGHNIVQIINGSGYPATCDGKKAW